MAATRRLRCLPCLLRRPTLSPPYVRRRQPAHPEHSLVAQPIRPTATPFWTPLLSPVAAGGVRSTLAISCEAVPAPMLARGRRRRHLQRRAIPCRRVPQRRRELRQLHRLVRQHRPSPKCSHRARRRSSRLAVGLTRAATALARLRQTAMPTISHTTGATAGRTQVDVARHVVGTRENALKDRRCALLHHCDQEQGCVQGAPKTSAQNTKSTGPPRPCSSAYSPFVVRLVRHISTLARRPSPPVAVRMESVEHWR